MKVLTRGFIFTFFLIFLVIELITSCAKEAMPLGGPKDTIPPQIKWSIPQPYQKNFRGNKVIIKFNEFFVLKNISKEFFVSPPFAHRPVFRIRGKKLIIAIKDTLRDSVTYTMEFGKSIADFTEGNVLENYKLIFSTYDQIDSLRVSGKVVDAFTQSPLDGIYVMLYKKTNDSVIYQEPPQYVTVTNKQGRFTIVGVKKGCYKIVAINDLNFDFIYDGIENQIAFSDSLICPDVKLIKDTIHLAAGTIIHDTTGKIIDTLKKDSLIVKQIVKYLPDSLTLYMFSENTRPQQVVLARRPYPYLCVLRFNYPLHKNFYQIHPLNGTDSDFRYIYHPWADTLNIWITNPATATMDSLGFIVKYYSPIKNGEIIQQDTVFFSAPINPDYKITLTPLSDEINPFDSLELTTNVPLKKFDTNKMQLIQAIDTSLEDPKEVKATVMRIEPDEINIIFSRPLVKNFSLQFTDYPDIKPKIIPNHDSTFIRILLPEKLSKLDTVKAVFSYSIERFFNYDEFYRKKLKLTLVRQNLEKYDRLDWKTIRLKFTKPIRDLSIKGTDAIIRPINHFTADIILKNPQDSVSFTINTLDFQHLGVEPIYYQREINSQYKFNPNKIIKTARPSRGQVIMQFQRKPAGIFLIDGVDKKVRADLNQYTLDSNMLTVNFMSKEFKRLKVNKIVIGHYDYDRDSLVKLYDTVEAEIGQNPFLKNTTVYKPVIFAFVPEKENILQYHVSADYQSDASYKFLAFPGSFTDIMDKENDSIYVINFKTTDVEKFGKIKLIFTDYPSDLQLIIQLLDKDNNIIKEVISDTSQVILDRVNPGDYTVRIIFDKNKNNRWDTGNYLRKEQPEKVAVLPKKITAKPNWEIEETISIKELEKM